jgi:PKHD-type hydroxylase
MDFGEFEDGKASGPDNRNIKRNRELIDPDQAVTNLFMDAFREDVWCTALSIRHHTPPMFIEYDAVKDDQGHYDYHCDAAIMNGLRTDIVILTALNDHTEYEGGDLTLTTGNINVRMRLDAGQSVAFDPNLWHTVSPITKGKRRMCVIWAEALIQDSWARELFYDYIDINARCLNSIDEKLWYEQGNEMDPATYLQAFKMKLLRQYSNPKL